ncbi:DUF7336 domain-containing protein [Paraflavitalea pollutisoli]|uniref:DUF7336 domain-containing protein n=1 Tax=Paraflavitalea pollutisoli TaxID=3034143 RepID=UPI0023ECF1B0|nr:hypothetical protein [Paraflavitalea sp. H1-2-19X]
MKTAFILHHSYDLDGYDETKLIGIYSTMEQAELAINRLKGLNGFKYHPDKFEISEYELDKDHWTDGFATMTGILIKSEDNSWKTAQAECLPNDCYQVFEVYEDTSSWEFKHLDIVECEERAGILYAVKLVQRDSNQR